MSAPAERASSAHGPFLPLLLGLLALAGWSLFQAVQLARERSELKSAVAAQEPQVVQSQKLRAALDSIATQTQRLADGGNADAALIVEELRKRGVTIDAKSAAGARPR